MSGAVITGVGVAHAFGVGMRALLGGLAEGQAAVGPIRGFDATTFPTRVAAEVPLFGDALLARLPTHDGAWDTDGRLRDRKVVFALLAAAEAWGQAGCGRDEEHAALSIAIGLEQAFLDDFVPILGANALDWSAESAAVLPRVRFRSTLDLAPTSVRSLLALRGAMVVHASACAAGGLAVAHAASLITRGAADVVLCGGSDSMINPLGIGGMSRIGAPSPRAVADACRPFDRRRDGLAMGEGAAMFIVEAEDRARARGVRPLARVLGWGSTQDAYRATAPRPDGSAARVAMERALRRARVSGRDVGYVNAHGTGTPLNDPAEARAIRGAIGDHAAVSSIKGALGHLMAASGALELAACLLPFERDLLPGTAHLVELDPECEIDVIGPTPRPARVDLVVTNSFGFGGQNVSLVLGRPA
jgi:3-oxoacyl-[acyl-carrier-protein] synthase II